MTAPDTPAAEDTPESTDDFLFDHDRDRPTRMTLEREDFDHLLDAIGARGYAIVGPTLKDGAIVYDEITSSAELPIGWTDEQSPGVYRTRRRDDDALFGYAVGPHTWKRFLHSPRLTLLSARRADRGFEILEQGSAHRRLAFLGVRACEVRAIEIQDHVLLGGAFVDPHYAQRRRGALIVAVDCVDPGATCFCASMGSGPEVSGSFDIRLTEVLGERHYFLVDAGSALGAEICNDMVDDHVLRDATTDEIEEAETLIARASQRMHRSIDTDGIRDLFLRNAENRRWAKTAERCLTCGNCTMVCPTCFCTTVEDVTDLTGVHAERVRRWDSCFTIDFSYIHGGSVRTSARARYRHWITHKLATWYDQFGLSGCVGCGRCITWCPAGIDITEEARAVREGDLGVTTDAPDSKR